MQYFGRREFLASGAALCLAGCGFHPDGGGARFSSWGEAGNRNGEFVKPRAIGVMAREVYVVDTTGRVQVFDESGGYQRHWSVPEVENGTPTSVGFTAKGEVLIPDTHYHRVLVYSREGELVTQWGSYGTGPDQFIYPTGIVEGPDGALYVSEYGVGADRIHVFDGEYNFVRQWGEFGEAPGMFNRAIDIALGPDGGLYVVDMGNNRVQRFDTLGEFRAVIGESGTEPGQLKDPFDVAVLADASVLVCEYGNHRISRFAPEDSGDTYSFVTCYGQPGRGEGCFFEPRGVAVSPDSGAVFVADTGNHRIQRLELEALPA